MGCVGCVDGLVRKIKTPSSSQTGNVNPYFSSHYQAAGVNVQASCVSQSRFTYIGVAANGGASNIRVFSKTRLCAMVSALPIGKFVIGDNAYVASEHLITPFSGSNKQNPDYDTYNYYVSELRIKIEQAFGLLTTKWRILRHSTARELSKRIPSHTELRHSAQLRSELERRSCHSRPD